MGRTMAHSEDQQTVSSRTLDEVLKPLKYLHRRVLLLLCRVIAWGPLSGCLLTHCSDSLVVTKDFSGIGEEKKN